MGHLICIWDALVLFPNTAFRRRESHSTAADSKDRSAIRNRYYYAGIYYTILIRGLSSCLPAYLQPLPRIVSFTVASYY